MMIREHVAGTDRSRATITDAAGISKTAMSAATRSEAEEVGVRGTTMVAASRGPRYSHDSQESRRCAVSKQRIATQSVDVSVISIIDVVNHASVPAAGPSFP